MPPDPAFTENLAEVPAIVALAAGHSHTAASSSRLLSDFGFNARTVETLHDFGLLIRSGDEWRLASGLRKRVLTLTDAQSLEIWNQAHQHLLAEARLLEGDQLPEYQVSGAGLAYHGTEVDAVAGLEAYRELAIVNSVALSMSLVRLANEQVTRGLIHEDETSVLFVRGMAYYRTGMWHEAVDLLRRVAAMEGSTRETAIALHLVGNWDCLRSRNGDSESARQMLSRSHKLAAKLGDEAHLAHVKHTMALCLLKRDGKRHRQTALKLLRQSLALTRSEGDTWGEAKVLHSLGKQILGTTEGREALERSLLIGQELGYLRHVESVHESIDRQSRLRGGLGGPMAEKLPKRPGVGGLGQHEEVSFGAVKFFDPARGFGFISPRAGGRDVFVHFSVIEMPGYRTLKAGEPVEFRFKAGAHGPTATSVVRIQRSEQY